MIDWATVSSLATAGGTLVLAVATFSSVRSANRSARTAERALAANIRPLLMPSRLQDPPVKMNWADDHWASVPGGHGLLEAGDEAIYLAMSLRNVGSGIAVIHGWHLGPPFVPGVRPPRPPIEEFRIQNRDMYVPPGDVAFWEAAVRDRDDDASGPLLAAIGGGDTVLIYLLYGDHEGGQRSISLFSLTSRRGEPADRLCTVSLHWNLDRPDPR
jgi:hypothetical protein